ncbi:tyrosine-type recombinase/integrase [Paracoccus liaowanqingii]|uniref:tyrosine-type recombinase/integrase n=1 Tax=Paracoccus liaowanqingii TaxID=2560053 RepID=UPI00143D5379|nr:tyrosine-type recombinase/integrase [Paracoccus liaowanqingii]
MSANSVNAELRVIRRVVKLAQRDGFIVNPKLRITMLSGSVRKRKFSVQEETQILGFLAADGGESSTKARELFVFLLDTGVRLNEALHCEWSDFDLDGRTFEVHRSKTSSISSLGLTRRVHSMLSTKTNQPMPFFEMDRAVKCLRMAIDTVCNTPSHAKIIARDGRAVIHSCRDTFATRLISAGLTLYEGSKLLGHSSQHMTAKYSHLESRDVATRAASLLER